MEAEQQEKFVRGKITKAHADKNLATVLVACKKEKQEELSSQCVFENDHYLAHLAIQHYCDQLASCAVGTLHPKGIPTTLDIGTVVHKVSPCPRCCLGFHYNNWVPAPCGHTYHLHCLVFVLQECCSTLSMIVSVYLACKQVFHLDWMLCWGFKAYHTKVQRLESILNSNEKRDEMFGQIFKIYIDEAPLAAKVFKDAEGAFVLPPIPQNQV